MGGLHLGTGQRLPDLCLRGCLSGGASRSRDGRADHADHRAGRWPHRRKIPEVDGNGDPIPGEQGTVSQWRVRNGFSPNIFGLGLRKEITPQLKLKAQLSIWGTIEPPGQQKYRPIDADFREGWGAVEAPWGTVTLGRHLGLFSRGIVEIELLYAHQYGVGFHGNLSGGGPTAGLIGFGVLAAFFSPGIMYTTPDLAGLQLNLGVYDGVQIAGSWDVSRTPRPEFELTYTVDLEGFFAKAFVNGAYQKLYHVSDGRAARPCTEPATARAWSSGQSTSARVAITAEGSGCTTRSRAADFGGAELGQSGLRSMRAQDLRWLRRSSPSTRPVLSTSTWPSVSRACTCWRPTRPGRWRAAPALIKTQTGISAGFVYHFSKSFHWDIDYMRAMFRWYRGEKQDVNFVNTGVTLNW